MGQKYSAGQCANMLACLRYDMYTTFMYSLYTVEFQHCEQACVSARVKFCVDERDGEKLPCWDCTVSAVCRGPPACRPQSGWGKGGNHSVSCSSAQAPWLAPSLSTLTHTSWGAKRWYDGFWRHFEKETYNSSLNCRAAGEEGKHILYEVLLLFPDAYITKML